MPLIPIFLIWFSGWAVYRLLRGTNAQLDVAGFCSAWLLGGGIVFAVYYVHMMFLQANPSPLIFAVTAIAGAALMAIDRKRLSLLVDLRETLSTERLAGGLLVLMLTIMLGIAAFSGFNNDPMRLWMGRGFVYTATPDYTFHLDRGDLPTIEHNVYPPLIIHLYQWQQVFTDRDNTLGMKLPVLLYFPAMLGFVYAFLKRASLTRPLRWTTLFATLPIYWSDAPYGAADITTAAFLIGVVWWLWSYLEHGDHEQLWMAGIFAGLLTVVKQEGVILVGCVFVALIYVALRDSTVRPRVRFAVVSVLMGGVIGFASWYPLAFSYPGNPSDFSLNAFDIALLPEIALAIVRVLGEPWQAPGVWLAYAVLMVMPLYRAHPGHLAPFTFMPCFYLSGMAAVYLFSVWSGGPVNHFLASYNRLAIHVLPLTAIYVIVMLAERDNQTRVDRDIESTQLA